MSSKDAPWTIAQARRVFLREARSGKSPSCGSAAFVAVEERRAEADGSTRTVMERARCGDCGAAMQVAEEPTP